MKILLLINSIRVSGTEKLMVALSREFELAGHDVYLFPLITPFDKLFRSSLENEAKKVNILFPPMVEKFDKFFWIVNGITTRLFNWSIRSFLLQKFLVRKIRTFGIQLIVSNSYPTDLFVLPVSRETGVQYIIVDHGSYSYYLQEGRSFSIDPLKNCAELVGVSQSVVSTLRKRLPTFNPKLIYNGHIASGNGSDVWFQYLIDSKSHFIYCMHGRGAEYKGWQIAIDAYLVLRNKGYRIKLLLLSEGSYVDDLKARYSSDPDIIFGGFIYNLSDVFQFVDVGLVLTTKHEAFGLSILDYFDSAIPVVASNLGGIPEIVNFNNLPGGFLVSLNAKAEPILEEVVSKMESLMIDKDTYNVFSKNGKAIAKHFSIENAALEYMKLFKTVLNQ